MKTNQGFTLIELLIVVAIIAILAAIAVPNFLEAQTRSKVSRAKSDQRTITTAFEAYRVDTNAYPVCNTISAISGINAPDAVRMKLSLTGQDPVYDGYWPTQVTTPVAYLTSLPKDVFETKVWDSTGLVGGPFELQNAGKPRNYYVWIFPKGRDSIVGMSSVQADIKFMLVSPGPDKSMELGMEWANNSLAVDALYDPTNGTVSRGNVTRFGP